MKRLVQRRNIDIDEPRIMLHISGETDACQPGIIYPVIPAPEPGSTHKINLNSANPTKIQATFQTHPASQTAQNALSL